MTCDFWHIIYCSVKFSIEFLTYWHAFLSALYQPHFSQHVSSSCASHWVPCGPRKGVSFIWVVSNYSALLSKLYYHGLYVSKASPLNFHFNFSPCQIKLFCSSNLFGSLLHFIANSFINIFLHLFINCHFHSSSMKTKIIAVVSPCLHIILMYLSVHWNPGTLFSGMSVLLFLGLANIFFGSYLIYQVCARVYPSTN